MEKADPRDSTALREVALGLQKRFCPGMENGPKPKPAQASPPKAEAVKELPTVVNAPLDFELKGLDAHHPYLLNHGLTQETTDLFGLGFCSRGMLKDRMAIALNDHDGKLAGYPGRVVGDSEITEDNPRYRFPGERERNGKISEFRKSLFLYNGFRIKPPVDDLIVVEGFTPVWWLFQNDFPNTAAAMGADCSGRQAELIVSLVKPGGNKAGERLAQALLTLISPHRLVRWLKLTQGKQPTDLSMEQLKLGLIN